MKTALKAVIYATIGSLLWEGISYLQGDPVFWSHIAGWFTFVVYFLVALGIWYMAKNCSENEVDAGLTLFIGIALLPLWAYIVGWVILLGVVLSPVILLLYGLWKLINPRKAEE